MRKIVGTRGVSREILVAFLLSYEQRRGLALGIRDGERNCRDLRDRTLRDDPAVSLAMVVILALATAARSALMASPSPGASLGLVNFQAS